MFSITIRSSGWASRSARSASNTFASARSRRAWGKAWMVSEIWRARWSDHLPLSASAVWLPAAAGQGLILDQMSTSTVYPSSRWPAWVPEDVLSFRAMPRRMSEELSLPRVLLCPAAEYAIRVATERPDQTSYRLAVVQPLQSPCAEWPMRTVPQPVIFIIRAVVKTWKTSYQGWNTRRRHRETVPIPLVRRAGRPQAEHTR
jgi:hypothetical protein